MNFFIENQFGFIYQRDKISLSYIYKINSKNPHTGIIVFHANGYSAQTYKKILINFFNKHYSVFALNFSSHSTSENYENFNDWFFFRDQILEYIDYIKKQYKIIKIHLVGHSLGGATSLLAGSKSSEIISITAWDPVVFSPFKSFLVNFIDPPIAKNAEKRRDEFKNKKIIERSYRTSPSFKYWDEEVFNDYLNSCFYYDSLKKIYKLHLPKKIEAKIFRSLRFGHWKEYKKLKIPIFIYGTKNSIVCPKSSCKKLIKNHKLSQYELHPSGSHFFPMEDPEETANKTLNFIRKIESFVK